MDLSTTFLFNGCTGKNIELVRVGGGDARKDFVIGRCVDHGSVVAGVFGGGEVDIEVVLMKEMAGFGLEGLISTDTAGEDEGFDFGM